MLNSSKFDHVIFDYDGTIVDTLEKYFFIHSEVVKSRSLPSLSYLNYSRYRRSGLTEMEILKLENPHLGESVLIMMSNEFSRKIEMISYTEFVKVKPNAQSVLKQIQKSGCTISLCTFRKDLELLTDELKRFNLLKYFSLILCRSGHFEHAKDKRAMFLEIAGDSNNCLVVGDSENDFLSAKHVGFDAVMISDGLRSSEFLSDLGVRMLVPNLRTFNELWRGR